MYAVAIVRSWAAWLSPPRIDSECGKNAVRKVQVRECFHVCSYLIMRLHCSRHDFRLRRIANHPVETGCIANRQ